MKSKLWNTIKLGLTMYNIQEKVSEYDKVGIAKCVHRRVFKMGWISDARLMEMDCNFRAV